MLAKTVTTGITCLLIVVVAAPARAGMRGAAIVDIEYAPDQFVGTETHELMYSVHWLGETPAAGPSSLEFRPAKGTNAAAARLDFAATPTATPGQYLVEVTLPADGTWLWAARHSYGMTDLGSIEVAPPGAATVLHHDVLALTMALVLGVALARLVSRTNLELGTRVLDHISDIRVKRARWDDEIGPSPI